MPSVEFRELDRLLVGADAEVDAAEAHGCLAGALCARPVHGPADWVSEILADQAALALDGASRAALATLYAETVQSLGGGEMEFTPLLPDDDAPLAARAGALGAWCSGFLYGLGTGRLPSLERGPGDVPEVLRDLAEISRATLDPSEAGEVGEQAYAELVEFVRAGVQLVYDELAPLRDDGAAPTARH